MRVWPAAIVLLAAGCAVRSMPLNTSPDDLPTAAPHTLQDGVYTAEQGQRGEQIFLTICVRCHGAKMTGSQIVPPLIGEPFLAHWARKTVGDLFEKVRTTMPPGHAGQLSRQDYADVLAYVLSRNDFPAGSRELAAEFDALRTIRFAPEPEEAESGAASATMAGAPARPSGPNR